MNNTRRAKKRTNGSRTKSKSPTKKYQIDLVVADRGWIVEKIANEIRDALPNDEFNARVLDEPSGRADLTYFIPYSALKPVPSGVVGAWFTHQEEIEPAKTRFIEHGLKADFCLTPAKRYEDALRRAGVENVNTIWHGVDLDTFHPRLTLGVVGRTYHTGRKGESLISHVSNLPGVDIKFTGSGWPHPPDPLNDRELADFYRSLDYLLIPSTIEGGPVPLFEALASGCPVIASDVGCVPDFPHIPFKIGDGEDLRRVVLKLRDEKFSIREPVSHLDWRRFGEEHLAAFRQRLDAVSEQSPQLQSIGATKQRSYAIVAHGTENRNRGGPTTRISNISKQINAGDDFAAQYYGVEKSLKAGHADLYHLFNTWPLASAVRELRLLRENQVPTVFSPIALNLNHRPHFQDLLPQLLKDATTVQQARDVAKQIQSVTPRWNPDSGLPPLQGYDRHFHSIRQCLATCDHAIFLSEYEEKFVRSIGAKFKTSTIVPNGVDTEIMSQGDPKLFENTHGVSNFVLVVGRIESRKNQALVALALRNANFPVVFVGHAADPEYNKLVLELSGPTAIFLDRVEDREMLASAYKAASCLVLASWSEGAPLVALEAAAAGTPLVLSEMSSEREYFGEYADYVHPADIVELERLATKHVINPETQTSRVARSKFACAHFDITNHVDNTLRVYDELLKVTTQSGTKKKSKLQGYSLDLTHMSHHSVSAKNHTGVTGVEHELARALSNIQPPDQVYIWNSPDRLYLEAPLESVLTGNASSLATESANGKDWTRDFSVEVIPQSKTAPTLRPRDQTTIKMTPARFVMSAFKQSINALPDRLRDVVLSLIKRVRPDFNSFVQPELRAFGQRKPGPATVARRDNRSEALNSPTNKINGSGVVITSQYAMPNNAVEGTLFVFGQPWISNDRQLEDMIEFSQLNRMKLKPLVHDLLYVTDSQAFPSADRKVRTDRLIKLCNAAAELIVTSKAVAGHLRKFLEMHRLSRPIQRIRLGIPAATRSVNPKAPKTAIKRPFVLYVSSINARKQHEFLFDVWRSVYRELPRMDVEPILICVGKSQSGYEQYETPEVRESLERDNIRLTGAVSAEELTWYYENCLFTVYPSSSEGWGIPPLESLLFGKLCLVSETVPSALESENAALLKLPPSDFFGWRSSLIAFLSNAELRNAYNDKARQYEPVDWENAALELLEHT